MRYLAQIISFLACYRIEQICLIPILSEIGAEIDSRSL